MNKNEPVRHHYVSRFLLKPFCFEGTKFNYYDKESGITSVKDIKDIFVESNFYRDDINNESEPMKLEKDLARFEGEISSIIRKFHTGYEIVVTDEEYEKLQLFFAVMQYRGRKIKNEFSEDVTDEFTEFYSNYQKDQNFNDFWKRNLGYIVNCRSIKDVINHPNIDTPMKLFLKRDTIGLLYSYYVVIERRGKEDFIVNENYFCQIEGQLSSKFHMTLFNYYPISPQRMIIRVCNGVQNAPKNVSGFKKEILRIPHLIENTNSIKFIVKKIYEDDVKRINSDFYNDTREGIAFCNKANVSLEDYPKINKARDDYNAFLVEQNRKL
ncbi:DUF4238 domain-containing protein [uncultured Ruminococcus sp.]|uniref:DUF4238 domain-containing protein n=1 Tax=uncultured Ruminococcus sp. TaxID=165186 RepID=UPI0025CD58E2|nr:DUF4238 domain-containing protein [uncultured Ruminococcus sp.]